MRKDFDSGENMEELSKKYGIGKQSVKNVINRVSCEDV